MAAVLTSKSTKPQNIGSVLGFIFADVDCLHAFHRLQSSAHFKEIQNKCVVIHETKETYFQGQVLQTICISKVLWPMLKTVTEIHGK